MRANVRQCDIFLCIVAKRYEQEPADRQIDPRRRLNVEREYDEAMGQAKPTLIFVEEDDRVWSSNGGLSAPLESFAAKLQDRVVHHFRTLNDFRDQLMSVVANFPLRAFNSVNPAGGGDAQSSWEAYFSEGIKQANSRQGNMSDRAALEAYDRAIELAPQALSGNVRSKLLTYRAAMLKRLGRLQRAEQDLIAALSLASEDNERLDVHYNLACVYALQDRREEMYEHVAALRPSTRFLGYVASHRDDYFAKFKDDPKFLSLISR